MLLIAKVISISPC